MSGYTISIPDTVYEKARLVAQLTSRQVDDVIRARLESALDKPIFDLPADEQTELKAMRYLSDDALWAFARELMRPDLQERMSDLMTKKAHGRITDEEYAELAELVERGNNLTLRKAQAMEYLRDRGYSINQNEK